MGLQYNFEEHRKPNQQKGTKKVPNVENYLKYKKVPEMQKNTKNE